MTRYAKANKRRWSDPDYRKRVGKKISIAHKKQSQIISQRVRRAWQLLSPSARRIRLRGLWKGPGRISKVQQQLWRALGAPWRLELSIGLGVGAHRRGLPSRYFIDIAHPKKKIAVEVDGSFHKLTRVYDRKRDLALTRLGWKVVRVSNRDVQFRLADVVQAVRGAR